MCFDTPQCRFYGGRPFGEPNRGKVEVAAELAGDEGGG